MSEPRPVSEEKVLVYRCWYDDPQGARRYVDVPRERGIATIREGLWLNAEFEFGIGERCLHWLPPGRIVLVTKLEIARE